MRYRPEHKADARARLIAAVGRGFRRHGFGGIGVDGLAKEAQATSGAFYAHFASKEVAFKEAVTTGIDELRKAIVALQAQHADKWLPVFVDFYVGYKRTCEAGDSCALQSLSPEVERADVATREVYEASMLQVVDAVAHGLVGGSLSDRKRRAWALLSVLSGGVTLARAVPDRDVSNKIAKSIKAAALQVAREETGG